MRFNTPLPHSRIVANGIVLGTVALFGLAPWTLVADEVPKSDKVKQSDKPRPNGQSGAGDFVSYKDGKLTLRNKAGVYVWSNVGEKYKAFQRDEDGSKQVDTVAALSQLKADMYVRVNVEKAEISFGVDEQTHGTFVSYKDGKLTLIGKAEELGPSFTKKYGTTLSPQIDPKTPVVESIDGSEYKPVGTAEALSSVKEGTIITLRGKNDTITLIQIGVKKKASSR